MELKRLKIVNFRQFYGEQTLNFSNEEGRNITLIHGENGLGKTTILNSLLWCLFGNLTEDFEEPELIISKEARDDGVSHARVELWFSHDRFDYHVIRSIKESRETTFKVHTITDGNYEELPYPKSLVNSVLPEGMAGYFFFHGEGATSLSKGKTGSRFRNAIRDILGFSLAEQAIDDMRTIKMKWNREASKLLKGAQEFQVAATEKANLEETIEENRQLRDEAKASLEALKDEYTNVEEEIINSGSTSAERIQRDLKSTADHKRRTESQLRLEQEERKNLIQKYSWTIVGRSLANEGLDFIDESQLKGRIPAPYDQSFVDDLVESGECICGEELVPGSEKTERVLRLLETANTAVMKDRLVKARSIGGTMLANAKEFIPLLKNVESKIIALDSTIKSLEEREKDLEVELQRIKDSKIEELRERRNQLRVQVKEADSKFNSFNSNISRAKSSLEQVERVLLRAKGKDDRYDKLSSAVKSVDELIDMLEGRLEEYEDNARSEIASSVDEILKRFSRKSRSVRVGENFNFYMVDEDGRKTPKSKGENLLLNLAFVSALIQFAKLRESASGKFLIRGTTAPFLIDAPFGELDETYRHATCEFLPGNSRQLVLLLSSSHFHGGVDSTIRPHIGKEYLLVSYQKAEQEGKPDDEIEIYGKRYKQSVYGAERSHTVIREI
jgi:DNA sulfur modification protein DndD